MWNEDTWLTTTIRPAGLLDSTAVTRLADSVAILSTTCDLVVLDLSACAVEELEQLAEALRLPARRLAAQGGCLMLRGASDDLIAAMSPAPLAAVG
ncbi:MAG: hypothetical protein JWM02_535 [Frankiales bacterium]|nr:hypothetical protein [Frankiales bacterium]